MAVQLLYFCLPFPFFIKAEHAALRSFCSTLCKMLLRGMNEIADNGGSPSESFVLMLERLQWFPICHYLYISVLELDL